MIEHLWETQRAWHHAVRRFGPEEQSRQPGEFFTVPAKAKEWCGPPRPVIA